MALAPLIVIWFGLGLASKVINAALVAFFPLLVNTMVGLRSADEDRVSLMRSLAASERQIFWMLRLPNALPFVMAGLDIAMIFALIGAIVAEFVGATAGLGMLIQIMNFTMDVSGQFSVLLILSVRRPRPQPGIQLVRRRVLFWDPSEKGAVEAPEVEMTTQPRSPPPARRKGSARMRSLRGRPGPRLLPGPPARRRPDQAARGELRAHRSPPAPARPLRSPPRSAGSRQEGLEVELVPLPGSTDCVKNVATREVPVRCRASSPWRSAAAGHQGQDLLHRVRDQQLRARGAGGQPHPEVADLKGKIIGVTNMASAGVIIARAQVAAAGLNPDTDVTIVVAGEGAQPAAMLRNKQVDALSQFDTQYALIEIAGVKMRYLDPAPSRASRQRLPRPRGDPQGPAKELVGARSRLRQGHGVHHGQPRGRRADRLRSVPATKPTGKDEATAVRDDVKVLQARMPHWRLEPAGVKQWGENSEVNYRDYADFLLKWG